MRGKILLSAQKCRAVRGCFWRRQAALFPFGKSTALKQFFCFLRADVSGSGTVSENKGNRAYASLQWRRANSTRDWELILAETMLVTFRGGMQRAVPTDPGLAGPDTFNNYRGSCQAHGLLQI